MKIFYPYKYESRLNLVLCLDICIYLNVHFGKLLVKLG